MKKIVTRHSLAVAALVLAVIVPVTLFLVGRQSKSLSFTLVARSPLVDVSQPQIADLEVSYRGEKIQRVESVTLLFEKLWKRGHRHDATLPTTPLSQPICESSTWDVSSSSIPVPDASGTLSIAGA